MNYNRFLIFFSIIAGLCLTSCYGIEKFPDTEPLSAISFDCVIENADASFSKITLDGSVSSLWDSGDMISVFDGVANRKFITQDRGKTAVFKGNAYQSSIYYAIYPYDEAASYDGETIKTSLKTNQKAVQGNYPEGGVIMLAHSEGESLSFKSLVALLKISVPSGVKTIRFKSFNRVKIAGNFSIDPGSMTVSPEGCCYDEVILSDAQGQELVPGVYYLAVLPCTLEGCRLIYEGTGINEGKVIVKESSRSNQLYGGTIYDMGDVSQAWSDVIGTGISASFSKGVNLAGCFEVGANNNADNIWMGHINDEHFSFLASIGVDVVRIPMQLGYFVDDAMNYHLQDSFFKRLDETLDLAEKYGITVIIDNHIWQYYNVQTNPYLAIETIWLQIANHCKSRSQKIVYELFNEPDGDYWRDNWHQTQSQLIQAIRAVDDIHTIIVTPAPYKSISDMPEDGGYADKNIMYTIHIYSPFIFTHQGTSWTPLASIGGLLHFPHRPEDSLENVASIMTDAGAPADYVTDCKNYAEVGTYEWLQKAIQNEIDEVNRRGRKLYVGEFGTYKAADHQSRMNWLRCVSEYLDRQDVAWTMWTYATDFGMFKNNNVFMSIPDDLDTDIASALGFEFYANGKSGLVKDYELIHFNW